MKTIRARRQGFVFLLFPVCFCRCIFFLSVVRGGEWGRFLCPRAAASLPGLRAVCGFCAWPALLAVCLPRAEGAGFSLTPSRLLACTSEMQEFAASPAAARALCRRWARVLHLCFRPACLASFRFCEGFHACRLFARPVCCLRGFSLLSFAFSCLTFASQKSFHLSLMPRRAPHFLFGKKMGEKNREGARRAPFEPHSCALRPISPFRAAGRLNGPLGRKPPADGETLEKPRSKAQLFKRFCAKGDACALSPINLFFSLLAGLTALRAANRRLTGETPEKPKEQSSAFRAFLCVGDAPGTGLPGLPGRREQEVGFLPARENRSSARARTQNQPRACETRERNKLGARIARRSRA